MIVWAKGFCLFELSMPYSSLFKYCQSLIVRLLLLLIVTDDLHFFFNNIFIGIWTMNFQIGVDFCKLHWRVEWVYL